MASEKFYTGGPSAGGEHHGIWKEGAEEGRQVLRASFLEGKEVLRERKAHLPYPRYLAYLLPGHLPPRTSRCSMGIQTHRHDVMSPVVRLVVDQFRRWSIHGLALPVPKGLMSKWAGKIKTRTINSHGASLGRDLSNAFSSCTMNKMSCVVFLAVFLVVLVVVLVVVLLVVFIVVFVVFVTLVILIVFIIFVICIVGTWENVFGGVHSLGILLGLRRYMMATPQQTRQSSGLSLIIIMPIGILEPFATDQQGLRKCETLHAGRLWPIESHHPIASTCVLRVQDLDMMLANSTRD